MDWQEAGVLVIVGGAVWFLLRRFVGRRPAPPAETFVSLDEVRRRRDGCH